MPVRRIVAVTALVIATACSTSSSAVGVDGRLAIGTWGGDSGGFIIADTSAHLHVDCTFGDVSGSIMVGSDGRFSVPARYMLRAYPIAVGPTVPAVLNGRFDGETLTITATVNDTVEKRTVVRGPVTLRLGVEPRLANCPICRVPGSAMSRPSSPAPSGS